MQFCGDESGSWNDELYQRVSWVVHTACVDIRFGEATARWTVSVNDIIRQQTGNTHLAELASELAANSPSGWYATPYLTTSETENSPSIEGRRVPTLI